MRKRIQLALAGMMCFLLTGCGGQETYEFAKAETDMTVYAELMSELTPLQFIAVGFVLYVAKYVFVISIFSIVLGFVIVFSIKNSPQIRKNAITGLIIGVPLVTICLYVLAKMIAATAGI